MKYNDFDLVANPNGYGYVQDENEDYYKDALATEPIPQGKISPNIGGLSAWYLSDGTRAVSQFTKRLKCDAQYCDSDGTPNPSGDYIVNLTSYYDLLQSDALTTTVQFVANLPVPYEITGSIVDNPLFIQATPFQLVQYDRVMTNVYPSSEIARIGNYIKLNETAVDSTGVSSVDVNGVVAYAWKETTTVL